jgi:hypothetical protein
MAKLSVALQQDLHKARIDRNEDLLREGRHKPSRTAGADTAASRPTCR